MTNPKVLTNARVIQKCLIVDNNSGNILVLQRGQEDNHRGLKWDFPGGGYEQGEDITESLYREVLEESALVVHSAQPIFVDNRIGEKSGLYAGDHVFAICQLSNNWEGEVTLSDEHIASRWLSPEDALNLDYGDDGGFFTSSLEAYLAINKQSA